MSDEMSRSSSHYPDPFIAEPISGVHKQSWIVLHGRGDNAHSFATGMMGFLNLRFPDDRTIQEHLPDVRFVFPTASHRRAQRFNRAVITQWFDIYSWDSKDHSDWQAEGLRETCAWTHHLLKKEIEAVGAENVVLGGLSQGCASSLISLLLWNGQSIKAVFGMSGWLPYHHLLELQVEEEPKDDVFERDAQNESEIGGNKKDPYQAGIQSLCQELEVEIVDSNVARKIPIFLAHGGKDYTVDIHHGRDAAACLTKLGCDVRYKKYPTLTHWMRGDELSDVVTFVQSGNIEIEPGTEAS